MYTPDNKRFEGDPRYVLERALNKMRDNGMIYMCAPEIEFFLVRLNGGSPDPAGNPYLQLAVLCYAALDGIKKKIDPGPPTELNVYAMSYEERKARGIISLPESLKEALDEMERSEFMKEALGEEAFNNFLSVKRKEWGLYRMQVTTWEVERYMRKL